MKDIFSKFMFNIPKNNMNFIMSYHFYLKEWNLKKVEKLVTNLYDKAEYAIHIRLIMDSFYKKFMERLDLIKKLL